jgi:hypothetical protein
MRYLLLLLSLLFSSNQYAPTHAHAPTVTPLNPCLVGAWAMNEGSGLTLHDTSGNNNTATINTAASVTWTSNVGLPGTTTQWNATGYALATSTTLTNFDGTTPFSATVWASPINGNAFALLGTLQTANGYKGWEFATKVGFPTLDFFLINSYPGNAIDVSAVTSVPTNTVAYFVVTYDGSKTAAGVKFYANGVLVTKSGPVADSLTSSTANGLPLRFGARSDGTNEFGPGPMAFAEVYNCVLTPTQVTTYNAAGPGIY